MHPVSFADMNISYRKSAIFVVSRNAGTDCILIDNLKFF